MLGRMQRHRPLLAEREQDPAGTWAIGRTHLGTLQPAVQGTIGDLSVWLHGDVWNHAAVARAEGLERDCSTRDLLASLYRRYGAAFAARLDGAYVVAILDRKASRLTLATDIVGSYPLYWQSTANGFSFCSDLTALIAGSSSTPRLDLRAVADYLTIGFVVGDRTLADGVRLLGPGETLVYDARTGQARTARHHEMVDLFRGPSRSQPEYIEELRATFTRAVNRALEGNHAFTLSLSGGLDSRAILSSVNGRSGQLKTYTLGIDGCADQAIAERLAEISGTDHRFFELNEAYLADFLQNLAAMVSLTDGMYFSQGLTEMLALQFIEQTGGTVLLRGHGGELAKVTLAWPLHTDETVYSLGSLREFVPYMAARANYLTPGMPVEGLLKPAAAQNAGRGSLDSLGELLSSVTLDPAQACAYLYLHEHHRRYTIPSLELFRSRIDVRLPFVDPDFLRVLLSAPARWRDDTSIHRALVATGDPALMRVRNSNTGAAVDAGRLTETLMDKLNTLLKRANVRGFRHYHNFEGWMRRMLIKSVQDELMTPSARVREWFRDDVLKRLIDETASSARSHGHVLQVLLILELWQRENGVAT
jgi:asparagine synthase (glutamine-hydrolysing)